jgi:hypothetical protein
MSNRVTRSKAAAAAGQSAPPTPRLVNPTLPENWPPEPSTSEEFQAWLRLTKAALQKWLTEAAAAAQDTSTANTIRDYTTEADRRWEPFERQTDVETGEIYDEIQRAVMETAAEAEEQRRADLHQQHETWRKFAEYRYAQAAWEDFLYFQNVWNRRNYEPLKIYSETASGRRGARIRRAFEQVMRPEGKESASDGDVMSKAKAGRKKTTREYGLERAPILGTPDQDRMDRTHDNWSNEPFFGVYSRWLYHMIGLYTAARLGYRKRVPHVVAPEDAHRYTQPPRGTTPQALRSYVNHGLHLEERFPRKRRVQIDVNEIEEQYRGNTERARDIDLDGADGMKPICWKINEEAYENLRVDTEVKSGFSTNPRTLRLLPKDHKIHHGSRETTFYWPTSFDSPEWGGDVAVTAVRRGYAYEEISDPKDDPSRSKKKRGKSRGYKVDEEGEYIRKVEDRPRHKRERRTQQGMEFEHDMLGTGVAGRDQNDRWIGSYVHGNVSKERWKLDDDDNRIPLPPQYVLQNKFATFIAKGSNIRDTRPERHNNLRITDQLSDNEDDSCVDANENFPWSGNMNPEQLGDPWASSDESGDEEGADHPGDSDDDESDDDGDLFLISYRECSKCPKRERARLLLESLHAKYDEVPGWTVEEIMRLQNDDDEFENLSDEQITENYILEAVLMKSG